MPFPAKIRWLRRLAWLVTWPVVLWAFGALWYVHAGLAAGFVGLALFIARFTRHRAWSPLAVLALGLLALGGWAARPARNDRTWTPDVAQTAWAEINGDVVTLHNHRNFDWRSETDFTPRWETRAFRLSQLRHLDFVMTYWSSPHVGHTMITFDFGPDGRLCASIEARREPDEDYSPLAGLFRRYELVYVMGDERDLIRLRTRIRAHNDVYLSRVKTTPEFVRTLFLDYVATLNALRDRPAWYHSLSTNCSTTLRRHVLRSGAPFPWDWRVLLNGHIDARLHELDYISRTLPLPELRTRSHINAAAREADQAPDFSDRIRAGRPGF